MRNQGFPTMFNYIDDLIYVGLPHEIDQSFKFFQHLLQLKTYCSKCDLQSLLGSLLYITKCIKLARFFLNLLLSLLRQNVNCQKILLIQSFFADLNWFLTFLDTHNGTTYYKVMEQDALSYRPWWHIWLPSLCTDHTKGLS